METNLSVTQSEGQLILNALSKMPFEQVAELIFKIQKQASDQMEKQAEMKQVK